MRQVFLQLGRFSGGVFLFMPRMIDLALGFGARAAVALLLIGAGAEALARGPGSVPVQRSDARDNWRESCRRIVAGTWLAGHDELVQSREWVRVIDGKSTRTRKQLETERARLTKLRARAKSGTFQVGESAEADTVAGLIATLEADLAANEALRPAAGKRLAAAEARDKYVRASIDPVFRIVALRAGETGDPEADSDRAAKTPVGPNSPSRETRASQPGYPFRIEYRSSCPKFRFQCPLPTREAAALRKLQLSEGAEPPEPCLRYAGIGQP